MKKYMIRCDMEGVSGVTTYSQVVPGQSGYEQGARYFMSDLLAAINGLFDGGADQVHIYDEHCDGRNVDLSALPRNVFVYCGKAKYIAGWAGGLDSSFKGLVLLGLHSKAGTEDALLNHTYESDIMDINVNGRSVGEIGLEAAIAGEMGVPLIMVTADSEGIREAKELVPDVYSVSVKQSLGQFSAVCYPIDATAEEIRTAAKEAAVNAARIKPFKFKQPAELTITLREGIFCDGMRIKPNTMNDKNQLVIRKSTLLEAYATYWDMKLSVENILKGK